MSRTDTWLITAIVTDISSQDNAELDRYSFQQTEGAVGMEMEEGIWGNLGPAGVTAGQDCTETNSELGKGGVRFSLACTLVIPLGYIFPTFLYKG